MGPTRRTTKGNLQSRAKKPAPPGRRNSKNTDRQSRQAVARVGLNQTDTAALADIVVSRLEGSMKSHVEKLVVKQLDGGLQPAAANGEGGSQDVVGLVPTTRQGDIARPGEISLGRVEDPDNAATPPGSVGHAEPAELHSAAQTEVAGMSVPPSASLARLPASYPFPLDARVGPKFRAKILAGEFVNFSDLLDPPKAENCKMSLKQGADEEVVFVREQNTILKQSIRSINDWDRAFATFVTVYSGAHPAETSQLIKYGERVKRIAQQGGEWAHYDVGFRGLRHTTPIPWDYFHAELYTEAVSGAGKGRGNSGNKEQQNDSCPN